MFLFDCGEAVKIMYFSVFLNWYARIYFSITKSLFLLFSLLFDAHVCVSIFFFLVSNIKDPSTFLCCNLT